jgi:hypothetical protein
MVVRAVLSAQNRVQGKHGPSEGFSDGTGLQRIPGGWGVLPGTCGGRDLGVGHLM